jgi:putative salt-induced outer membrane protein YdiY
MFTTKYLMRLVACFLFGCFCTPLYAKDLIRTLYHAEYTPDTDDEIPRFTLDGELGVLLNSGNTSAASIKAALNADHETQHWSNVYFAELLYKESGTATTDREVSAQRFYTTAQFDYKLVEKGRRLFMYGDYEDNRFSGYEHRASLAAGWSQRLWRDEDSEFRYSIGPGYTFLEAEEDNDSLVNDGIIVRASAEYRYRWTSGARLRQFFSTEAGEDNTKSRSETSLSANVFGSLAMKLSFILNHETDTADDVEALSTETSVALVYQFF